MVVTLWRRCNRCRAAMHVQALRRRAAGIFGHRLVCRGLLRPLGLAFGRRRHCWAGTARRDRWLVLLVAPAQAHIGETLEQRQARLLRGLPFRFAAGLPDFGFGRALAVRRISASAVLAVRIARRPGG